MVAVDPHLPSNISSTKNGGYCVQVVEERAGRIEQDPKIHLLI